MGYIKTELKLTKKLYEKLDKLNLSANEYLKYQSKKI